MVTPDQVGRLDADGNYTPIQSLTVITAALDVDGRQWLLAEKAVQIGLWVDGE